MNGWELISKTLIVLTIITAAALLAYALIVDVVAGKGIDTNIRIMALGVIASAITGILGYLAGYQNGKSKE